MSFPCVDTTVVPRRGVPPGGVYSGNQPNFLVRVPTYLVHFLCDLITNPEKSHFHGTRLLPFDGVVGYADGRCVIAVDRGFGFRMSHVV